MEERYKRKPSENEIEYGLRLIEIKKTEKPDNLDWSDIVDLVGLDINKDSLRKSQDTIFGGYSVAQYYKNKQVEGIEDNDLIEEYERKIIELKKERKKLQTINLEYNKTLRQDARNDLYIERIEEAITSLKPFEKSISICKENNGKTAIVNLADAHVGKQGIIKGLKGEIINEYNFDIFQKRMWQIYDEVIEIVEKENISEIKLLTLGDMVEGILRNSQLQALEMGVIDSVLEYSEFMSTWIFELSRIVFVDYYSAYGNHDGLRLLQAKSAHDFPHENVGRLIDKFLSARLKNIDSIKINDNQLPFSFIEVYGMNVLAMHGEDKDLVSAIKDYTMMYGTRIDMLITGHMHKGSIESIGIGQFGDIEVVRIPSICGIDDFSVSIKKFSSAGSRVFIIEENKGKTITYDIKL